MTPEQAGKTNRKGGPSAGDVAIKGNAQTWHQPGSKGTLSRPSLGRLAGSGDHCSGQHNSATHKDCC